MQNRNRRQSQGTVGAVVTLELINVCVDARRTVQWPSGDVAGDGCSPSRDGLNAAPAFHHPVTPPMASPTPHQSIRCIQRGVFNADPLNPPPTPSGAHGLEIVDSSGRVIAFAWVLAEHANEQFFNTAWDWLDAHDHATGPYLRLWRP